MSSFRSNMILIIILTLKCVNSQEWWYCDQGTCTRDCNNNDCAPCNGCNHDWVCTDSADGCTFNCNTEYSCQNASIYAAADNIQLNCNAANACKGVNIFCGMAPDYFIDNNPAYNKSDFDGKVNLCQININADNAFPQGSINCNGNDNEYISQCQLNINNNQGHLTTSSIGTSSTCGPYVSMCTKHCAAGQICDLSSEICDADLCQTFTASPTRQPTALPIGIFPSTISPTTYHPTIDPTFVPSFAPTLEPTTPLPTTPSPTTTSPSADPTFNPTFVPSLQPTLEPTPSKTASPTSVSPTISPTINPTVITSLQPTLQPTITSTSLPSSSPTKSLSSTPSNKILRVPKDEDDSAEIDANVAKMSTTGIEEGNSVNDVDIVLISLLCSMMVLIMAFCFGFWYYCKYKKLRKTDIVNIIANGAKKNENETIEMEKTTLPKQMTMTLTPPGFMKQFSLKKYESMDEDEDSKICNDIFKPEGLDSVTKPTIGSNMDEVKVDNLKMQSTASELYDDTNNQQDCETTRGDTITSGYDGENV